jgi:hypothetical protein
MDALSFLATALGLEAMSSEDELVVDVKEEGVNA